MWTQIKDELRFLALEVSGSFKERWEGPPQPIRTLLYQPLSSKLRPPLPSTCVTEGHTGFQKWVWDKATHCINFCLHWGKNLGSLDLTDADIEDPLWDANQQPPICLRDWGVCKHTCRHTLQGHWSKTQRWTETSLNSDQISANNHVHLTD